MSLNQLIADRRKRYLSARVESLTSDTQLNLKDGSNEVSISAASGSASYPLVLPPAQGTAGETLVNDGAGNLSWNPSGSTGRVTGSYNVYINTDTGNDANDGLTPGTAVATMDRAIAVLSTESYDIGIINIAGVAALSITNQDLDLYNDNGVKYNALDFTSISSQYGLIKVSGQKSNLEQITVNSTANLVPNNQWRQAATAGTISGSFTFAHCYNQTKKKFMMIEQNAAASVDLIGNEVGVADVLDLYNTTSTLTCANGLAIVCNTLLEIENIEFNWAAQRLYAVSGENIRFNGCNIDITGSNYLRGKFYMNGCKFVGDKPGVGSSDEWLFFGDSILSTVGFRYSNNGDTKNMMIDDSTLEFTESLVTVKNLKVDNNGSNIVAIDTLNNQSVFIIDNCWVRSGVILSSAIRIVEGSAGRFNNLNIVTTAGGCITVGGGHLYFNGTNNLVAPNAANVAGISLFGGTMETASISGGGLIDISGARDGIIMEGAKLINDNTTTLTITAATTNCIFAKYGSEILFANSTYTFASPSSAVNLKSNSKLSSIAVGVVNGGGGQPLEVGANAPGAWTTQAELVTQFCTAYIGP
jgi:hypothetical protein